MRNLKSLLGKLNETSRHALEGAAGLCLARTNYEVDVEHLLIKLLETSRTDLTRIMEHFEVNASRLSRELTTAVDRFKTGNARTPALSPRLPRLISDAWLLASIDFGAPEVRSGHLILALLVNEELSSLVRHGSKELQLIKPDALREKFATIVAGSEEDRGVTAGPDTAGDAAGGIPVGTKALDKFTIDLTARAKKGEIEPITGRDFEIRQMVDILMRRRQNNPILTGEAGVGKTAVVEGLALRIAHGDVPQPLQNVSVRTLDLALLQAGAGIKGEFENRLKGLIEEVKASPKPIILFIDEAHTMIGAGGQAGQGDAANLLKPALARGELRTIAATTWAEYKKYFERDAALARRFQPVKVEEPVEAQAIGMMRGLVPALEKHHKVRILDEGLTAAVHLSHRYLAGRQLPDKAVSVLDTACARLALGQSSVPPAVEDAMRQLDDLALQTRVLEREAAAGSDHSERLRQIAVERNELESRLGELRTRWDKERVLVTTVRQLRHQLEQTAAVPPRSGDSGTAAQPAIDRELLRSELAKATSELDALQGE